MLHQFLEASRSNPLLTQQLIAITSSPEEFSSDHVAAASESSAQADWRAVETISALKEHVTSLERELMQRQHEKEVLSSTIAAQIAESEADMTEVLRASRDKDDTIRTLRDEAARLRANVIEADQLRAHNAHLEAQLARLAEQQQHTSPAPSDQGSKHGRANNDDAVRLEGELQREKVQTQCLVLNSRHACV